MSVEVVRVRALGVKLREAKEPMGIGPFDASDYLSNEEIIVNNYVKPMT